MYLNIRGYTTHEAELCAVAEQLGNPTFIGVVETFLTKKLKHIKLAGYSLISRRDRTDNSGWGGILLFVKNAYRDVIVHAGDSLAAERSWHLLHTDRGLVSLCLWYRPPAVGEIESITSLTEELEKFGHGCIGTMIFGDMNVHNVGWLTFSSGSSPEGRELQGWCAENGFEERVKKPTRGEYLLDLLLTDMAGRVRATVVPGMSDHEAVYGSLRFPKPDVTVIEREVFLYAKANWKGLETAITDTDWNDILTGGSDQAATNFTVHLLLLVEKFIPKKRVREFKRDHPWLTDLCREAIAKKRAAFGKPGFAELRDACAGVLKQAYADFVTKTREQLIALAPSSREWWKLAQELMSLSAPREVIPTLSRKDGTFARSNEEKAELFSETFEEKAKLPEEEQNEFSSIAANDSPAMQDGFLPLRTRTIEKILKRLDETSGTGPDRVSTRVLRKCHLALAHPVTRLARIVLAEGRWPLCWRTHWMHPLHKKGSKSDPNLYRGVHLTSQVSKVVERAIGSTFLPWMHRERKFGESQYAYTAGRSHKDALAVNVCSWLLSLESGNLLGLYCSDVSGAFDRVRRERIVAKIRKFGLHPSILLLLESWLEDRASYVIVGGRHSSQRVLKNSVFQGTVLGPPLWNGFFGDAKRATSILDFFEVVFADDFNCAKEFSPATTIEDVMENLKRCQESLHSWGRANSVSFDAKKESLHVLHRRQGCGGNFKQLGVTFDARLSMEDGIGEIANEAGWRLRAILRPQRFFKLSELMRLYKSQVLSYLESATPAIFHAAPSHLFLLDRIQRRFIRAVSLDECEALEEFRLAPLTARRHMAMLGLLHRIVLGIAPAQLADLFPLAIPPNSSRTPTRLWLIRHDKQLCERRHHTDVFGRSLFGMARVYNFLPQTVANSLTVKMFQRSLQNGLRRAAKANIDNWQNMFSPISSPLRPSEFQQILDNV